jgi:L-rhamnose mutarotase
MTPVKENGMQRYGMVIGVKPEMIVAYKQLHAAVWPAVVAQISRSHIRNYSIYLREPENLLFSYFEYDGRDFAADMATMAADPETQRWWAVCMPCQAPLLSRRSGEHWATMEEVFHCD